MTTATQPGIEPGTSRFPGDCSTSLATGPGPTASKSWSHSLPLQPKECQAVLQWSCFPLSSRRSILSLSRYLCSTHPECSQNNFFATTSTFPSLGGFHWVGRPGTSVDSVENVVIGILSAGEGEGGSVSWSESDLAQ